MLPPGIHLLCSGLKGVADHMDVRELGGLHPSWGEGVAGCGPWSAADSEGYAHAARELPFTVVICGPCTSTMDVARHLLDAGVIGEWGGVVAPVQRAGRGQLRRPWVSTAGNLHGSLVWPGVPESGPWARGVSELLPILAGYAFAEALSGAYGEEIFIKWPNDLLLNDRKIGGVLTEEREGNSILGVGINLNHAPADEAMRSDRAVRAGCFTPSGKAPTALGLWETLVSRSKNVYMNLLGTRTPDEFPSLAAAKLAWLGSEVIVSRSSGEDSRAVVQGIAPDGGLALRRNGTRFVLRSGSIRPAW